MLVDGVKAITDLAQEIEKAHGVQKVKILDIGGVDPVSLLYTIAYSLISSTLRCGIIIEHLQLGDFNSANVLQVACL